MGSEKILLLKFSISLDTQLGKKMLIISLEYKIELHKSYCAQSHEYMQKPYKV